MQSCLLALTMLFVSLAHAKVEKKYFHVLGNFTDARFPKGTRFEGLVERESDDVKRTLNTHVVTYTLDKVRLRSFAVLISKVGNDWMMTTLQATNRVPPYKVTTDWPFKKIIGEYKVGLRTQKYETNVEGKIIREALQSHDAKGVQVFKYEYAGNQIDAATYNRHLKGVVIPPAPKAK